MNRFENAFGNFVGAKKIVFSNGNNSVVLNKGYLAIKSCIARVENKKRLMNVEDSFKTKNFDGLMYNAIKTEKNSTCIFDKNCVQVGIF